MSLSVIFSYKNIHPQRNTKMSRMSDEAVGSDTMKLNLIEKKERKESLFQRYGVIPRPRKLDFNTDATNWMDINEPEDENNCAPGEGF